MNAGYNGRQIVGIDLHRHRSVVVQMSSEGEPAGCDPDRQRSGEASCRDGQLG